MKYIDRIDKILTNYGTVTFTFVGDSITWGLNHCNANQTYVAFFTQIFADKYKESSIYRYDGVVQSELEPISHYEEICVRRGNKGRINIIRSGVGGNTVSRALNRFSDYTGVLPCGTRSDFIFTMFGINDSITDNIYKYVTADVFEQNYKKLIDDLKNCEPQAEIISMTATTSPFSLKEHVNANIRLAEEEKIPIIDLYSLWNNHHSPNAKNFGYGDWLSDNPDDPWHTTPIGSKAIADFIFDEFLKVEYKLF